MIRSILFTIATTWFCYCPVVSLRYDILHPVAPKTQPDYNAIYLYRRDEQNSTNQTTLLSAKESNSSKTLDLKKEIRPTENNNYNSTNTSIDPVSNGKNSSSNATTTTILPAKEDHANITSGNVTTILPTDKPALIKPTDKPALIKPTDKPTLNESNISTPMTPIEPAPTSPQPRLLHVPWEEVCHAKYRGEDIKILPVYMVGWGLEKQCDDFVPLERFKMEKYTNRTPKFDIPGLNLPTGGKRLTLIMVDPDAPSKNTPRCRSWLHWLVTNIEKGKISTGDEIVDYNPPDPHPGTGKHRYFFLLYEQGDLRLRVQAPDVRCRFNVRDFAEYNTLYGPVAVNMFVTEKKEEDERKEESKDEKKEESKDENKKEEKESN